MVDEVVVADFEAPHADALADGGRIVPIGLGAGVQTADDPDRRFCLFQND